MVAWTLGGDIALYAIAIMSFIGYSRYQTSRYMLQPDVETAGVERGRELEMARAFDDGVAHVDKGDLEAGEKSFQKALGLLEEITEVKPGLWPTA